MSITGNAVDVAYNVTGNFSDAAAGALFGGLFVLGALFMVLVLLAVYIYSAFALMTIAKKLKYKQAWLAWIPIVNLVLILQLGGFAWGWVFLMLIPVFGWIAIAVMVIISFWRIYEKRKYPGWFSLAILIPEIGFLLNMIALGFVAWKDRSKRLSFS